MTVPADPKHCIRGDENPVTCGCCLDEDCLHTAGGWDWTYGSCHRCAFCASLGHNPCCHGACVDGPRNRRVAHGPDGTTKTIVVVNTARLIGASYNPPACL